MKIKKTLTNVVLPIAVVAVVVGGFTFISIYSPPDVPGPSVGDDKRQTAPTVRPLKLAVVTAEAPKEEPNSRGEAEIPSRHRHLKYFDATTEAGVPGSYTFWAQNTTDRDATIRITSSNCQCAKVEAAVVPRAVHRDYILESALAGSPWNPALGPVAALAGAHLHKQVQWQHVFGDSKAQDVVLPAGTSSETQWALVRLSWKGKDDTGARAITAELISISNGQGLERLPAHDSLKVNLNVVPAFDPLVRVAPTLWGDAKTIDFGEIGEKGVSTRTIYFGSATRRFLLLNLSAGEPDPCLTWSEPVLASPEEFGSLMEHIRKTEQVVRQISSLYRVDVTLREQAEIEVAGKKEVRYTDLGLLERKLQVSAPQAGRLPPVALRARVMGQISIVKGAGNGRLDMGSSFPSDQDNTKDVVIQVDRPDIDVQLVDSEITPKELKVALEPIQVIDGAKHYRLRVTVPKGTISGSLPPDSAVVLKTTGPNPRRFRIPVRGMAYVSSGPSL